VSPRRGKKGVGNGGKHKRTLEVIEAETRATDWPPSRRAGSILFTLMGPRGSFSLPHHRQPALERGSRA